MIRLTQLKLSTENTYQVPIQYIEVKNATKAIIILPALGMAARFYIPLAKELARHHFNVILFEQRGHGDSLIRANSKTDYGFKQYLCDDIPAVFSWVNEHLENTETVLLGHSLGGHLAACYAALNPGKIDRVILSACSTPWIGVYSGKVKWQLKLLNRLIPIAHFLFGYYPGKFLGFGGNEARSLMNDWRVLVNENKYNAKGLHVNLESKIAHYTGKILSLSFDADSIAPYTGIKAVNDKFESARVEHFLVKSKTLGFPADHFKWVRKPSQVATVIKSWCLD